MPAAPPPRPVVGTLWSGTANEAAARHTRRPARRRPSKACGEVTSCTSCRSTYNSALPSSSTRTTCESHNLSYKVRGVPMGGDYNTAAAAFTLTLTAAGAG